MMKIKLFLPVIFILIILCSTFTLATTLKGTIYNNNLDPETDVLVEINTAPVQKYLAKDGTYSFELPLGTYQLKATKESLTITENVKITAQGEFVYDLFLLPDFTDEEDLWKDTEEELFFEQTVIEDQQSRWWAWLIAGMIFAFAIYRFIKARKKYGSLRKFKRRIKQESKKNIAEHQQELAQQPDLVDKALEIIKKNDGRITQKQLRKEMLYLSEAKVSLILTELEHKGKVEKVKKGRGNVLLLKKE